MNLQIILPLFLVVQWTLVNAQIEDYPAYFELTVQAREHFDNHDCVKANTLTMTAFSIVEYPAQRDIKKAIEIAVCLKDSELILHYCKMMAEMYGMLPVSEDFNDSALYNSIQTDLADEVAVTIQRFDKEYMVVLDSLMQEDRKIRKDGRVVYTDNINSDSLRTLYLLNLIEKRGFPDQRKVGLKGYGNAILLLIHSDFDLQNELLGDLMLQNVMNGNMNPRDYAGIIDRRCNFKGEPFVYYQAALGYDNLSEQEKAQVTFRRRNFGLRSVHESMTIEVLPSGDVHYVYKY